jgi:hypothetical protein
MKIIRVRKSCASQANFKFREMNLRKCSLSALLIGEKKRQHAKVTPEMMNADTVTRIKHLINSSDP